MDKKYEIEIIEMLQRIVEVKAENEEEALDRIKKMYRNEEIVLDERDFVDVEFKKY